MAMGVSSVVDRKQMLATESRESRKYYDLTAKYFAAKWPLLEHELIDTTSAFALVTLPSSLRHPFQYRLGGTYRVTF